VETDLQAMLLRQLGCRAYQGYYFAKPMPLTEFLSELRRSKRAEACRQQA
jgi:EAL domain-containing protein (putative c-di-GMP-specific phosphodiesterase class I)